MKEQDNKDKIIEDDLLDKALQYNYTKEIDKLHNHIAQLRLIAVSYQNIIKEKDKEIERLNNIIKQYDKISFIHEMELQKRISKAIEYIENDLSHATSNGKLHRKHLIDILKGEDKE